MSDILMKRAADQFRSLSNYNCEMQRGSVLLLQMGLATTENQVVRMNAYLAAIGSAYLSRSRRRKKNMSP